MDGKLRDEYLTGTRFEVFWCRDFQGVPELL
jgi:hypothetical protein